MEGWRAAVVFFFASAVASASGWWFHHQLAQQQINQPSRRDASTARIGQNTESEAIDGRS